ncbi:MAG: hypothetical protein ACC660_02280, partial [Acidimicrobiales bacterium]
MAFGRANKDPGTPAEALEPAAPAWPALSSTSTAGVDVEPAPEPRAAQLTHANPAHEEPEEA